MTSSFPSPAPSPADLKRLILDALACGDTRDGFRTRLRAALRSAGADDPSPSGVSTLRRPNFAAGLPPASQAPRPAALFFSTQRNGK